MSTINASTNYTPFHLHLGRNPRRLPLLTAEGVRLVRDDFPTDVANALEAVISIKTDIVDAHDALLASKISQANSANIQWLKKVSQCL
ncbi:hypothetical protein C8R48DRAFT_613946 [Suillus tomentosus]|nr:hypothetical protein C8R48DRAFT_613946 [Suillus tomentosus]